MIEIKYDVALSFASENREYVEQVAQFLKDGGIKVFYDEFETATLWGKDLYSYFDNIYQFESRYCMVFISEHYAKKLWTKHEIKSAFARAFVELNDYLLPVKIDDTSIPGVRATAGYIDARVTPPSAIAKLFIDKIQQDSINFTMQDRFHTGNIPFPIGKLKWNCNRVWSSTSQITTNGFSLSDDNETLFIRNNYFEIAEATTELLLIPNCKYFFSIDLKIIDFERYPEDVIKHPEWSGGATIAYQTARGDELVTYMCPPNTSPEWKTFTWSITTNDISTYAIKLLNGAGKNACKGEAYFKNFAWGRTNIILGQV